MRRHVLSICLLLTVSWMNYLHNYCCFRPACDPHKSLSDRCLKCLPTTRYLLKCQPSPSWDLLSHNNYWHSIQKRLRNVYWCNQSVLLLFLSLEGQMKWKKKTLLLFSNWKQSVVCLVPASRWHLLSSSVTCTHNNFFLLIQSWTSYNSMVWCMYSFEKFEILISRWNRMLGIHVQMCLFLLICNIFARLQCEVSHDFSV